MTHPVFFVNAFSDGFYKGNTAAVVLLDGDYPSDARMLALASEFNFSETAFLVRRAVSEYQIRWFTPEVEVPLCGHATLASARSLFSSVEKDSGFLTLHSKSGVLTAQRKGELIELDFPADHPVPFPFDERITSSLSDTSPIASFSARGTRNLVLVYASSKLIRTMQPDFASLNALQELPWFGIAVTARDAEYDYICRYFAPWEGINEDPVTGSAQTFLAPYWADVLGKNVVKGFQASSRGGAFEVEVLAERVLIRGSAFIYLQGELSQSWL